MENNFSKTEKTAIGFCSTYSDWFIYKDTILESFNNINTAFSGECLFIIVLQGKDSIAIDSIPTIDNYLILHEKKMGISNARNICIEYASKNDFGFILFHDSAIFWPLDSARYLELRKSGELPPKVNLCFGDAKKQESSPPSWVKSNVNPIYDTYIGSMLLKLDVISDLRFNLDHGPGEYTYYKSGEDVLFYFEYFKRQGSFNVYEAHEINIYHPKRPLDFSKHLLYARGQGRVFRVLLKNYFSMRVLRDVFLFFMNAILRCALMRKNSFKILRERLYGFFTEV